MDAIRASIVADAHIDESTKKQLLHDHDERVARMVADYAAQKLRAAIHGDGVVDTPDVSTYGTQSDTTGDEPKVGESWIPLDLESALNGSNPENPPTWLLRHDGAGMLYPGRTHAFYAEPEGLKTWLALKAVAEALAANGFVLYIDFEDTADAIVARLKALGVLTEAIRTRFAYIRPDEPLGAEAQALLDGLLAAEAPVLAVVDGITEAMALHGWDPLDNAGVASFVQLLPRRLEKVGAAVVLLDHVVKRKEDRGRYGFGGQHKLAAITGAAYLLEVIEPFGRGRKGRSSITVTKDRPGHVRARCVGGKSFGEVRFVSDEDGSVRADLLPPDPVVEGVPRPRELMGTVSRWLLAHASEDEPAPKKAIEDGVGGHRDTIRNAVHHLIAEGFVFTKKGDRGAILCWHSTEREAFDPDSVEGRL